MVYVVLVLLGLCLGSFVNALVWRLHEQQETEDRVGGRGSGKNSGELSILKGRSMCTHCRHELAWYDLLPVLSWLALRGKCRYCHKPISWQYPLVETVAAGLFSLSYAIWPYHFTAEGKVLFVFWLVFIVGFVALAVYDIRWMLLPDKLVYPLIALATAQIAAQVIFFSAGWAALSHALLGVLCLGGFFYVLFQLSKGKWIGGGDVKLGAVLGILAGSAPKSVLVLFIASVLGSLASLPLIAGKRDKRHVHVPFGPFLLVATFIVYLFGAGMLAWYKHRLLSF
ncbi:MAG TPA: prepilin peptidase [Candidatus Saccharimonadales bacterium]|nr:prepilin peptidase [Candidatus Saccharimonadales bacterium]